MATMTYDPSEQQEGQLSADEQDSLAVGEKMAEQEEQLLAGKYKDAEELEKAYVELQSKFSEGKPEEPQQETEEVEPEQQQEEVDFFEQLWEESQNDSDEYSEGLHTALESMSKADLAEAYLNARYQGQQPVSNMSNEDVSSLKDMVGGDESYTNMLTWAKSAFNEQEIAMYDQVMQNGDRAAAFFAVQALASRYGDSQGIEGEMLSGKAPRSDRGEVFKSQAAVVRAMSDPKYDKDPAYRQEIMEKLERSNLDF